jgi:hypothetical protein
MYKFFDKTNEALIKILDSIKSDDNHHEINHLAGHIASVYSAKDEDEAFRLSAVAVLEITSYVAKYWNKEGFKLGMMEGLKNAKRFR